ncbi:MAG: ABC transporter ATP-binding protein, partial [Planctomycetia bacterium]
ALDAGVQLQILELLRRLQAETGVSYLFISHSIGAVRCLAQRTLVLLQGRVVDAGETETLLGRPHHPYTRKLVGAHSWALTSRGTTA